MAMCKWYNVTEHALKEMSDRRLYSYYTQMRRDDDYIAIVDHGNMVDVTIIKRLLIEEFNQRFGGMRDISR